MRAAVVVFLLSGCAATEPTARSSTALAPLPAWVEGSAHEHDAPAPQAQPAIAPAKTKEVVSLGSDEKPPVHHGKRIDLDLVSADLPNVVRLIGEIAGVNVIVADGVSGVVTVKMKNVRWDEALDAIVASKGYRAERVGSIVIVRP